MLLWKWWHSGTEEVTREDLRDWLRALGNAIGKPRIAKKAKVYVQHNVMLDGGFDTRHNILHIERNDLTSFGMKRGDADAVMRSIVHVIQSAQTQLTALARPGPYLLQSLGKVGILLQVDFGRAKFVTFVVEVAKPQAFTSARVS